MEVIAEPWQVNVESSGQGTSCTLKAGPLYKYGILAVAEYGVRDSSNLRVVNFNIPWLQYVSDSVGGYVTNPMLHGLTARINVGDTGTCHMSPFSNFALGQNLSVWVGGGGYRYYPVRYQSFTSGSSEPGHGRIFNNFGDVDITR